MTSRETLNWIFLENPPDRGRFALLRTSLRLDNAIDCVHFLGKSASSTVPPRNADCRSVRVSKSIRARNYARVMSSAARATGAPGPPARCTRIPRAADELPDRVPPTYGKQRWGGGCRTKIIIIRFVRTSRDRVFVYYERFLIFIYVNVALQSCNAHARAHCSGEKKQPT